MTQCEWSDVEEAAKALAGNHLKFDSFGWHDKPEDSENWAIVYTHNRDSRLLELSNASAIEKEMEPFFESQDMDDPVIYQEHHGHWAVGWIDGYAIKVYQGGEITPVFRKWCELQERLADYALLDETDYSRCEYEATVKNIEEVGRRFVKDDSPKDWPSQAFSWFWNNNQHAVENRDDQGGYPSDDEMQECLFELDLLEDGD